MARWAIVGLVALAAIAAGGWLEQAAAQEGGDPGRGPPRMHRPDGANPPGPGEAAPRMGPPRGDWSGRGGPGRTPLTPEQVKEQAEKVRQAAADKARLDLGATEEEWTKLEPLIEKIKACQRDLRGPVAPAPVMRIVRADEDPPEKTEIEKKTAELNTILKDKDAAPARIKPALEALRQARAKVQVELTNTQKELRKLTNVRGEAYLLATGVLE